MDAVPRRGVLRFGDRELDLATGELHVVPRDPLLAVDLGTRPARLLALLAWRHGQLVTRDDFPTPRAVLIMGSIWALDDVIGWAERTGRKLDLDALTASVKARGDKKRP